ncbi:MAG: 50S ribosomal protein L21 [Bacteroidia bacterium]|nr:50S ribosomal protein L21 [Bacteroidia bacterium]NNM16025.1 50S ribosomal protein L21 [Bacteroidia bacterium]
MFAIINVSGRQYKVEEKQTITVNRMDTEEGKKVSFKNVLLIDNKGKVNMGAPTIKGAEVTGKVISHDRADKVMVFKKKRRKGYRTLNGHRQDITQIQIEKIKAKAAPAAKKEAAPAKKETAAKTEDKK